MDLEKLFYLPFGNNLIIGGDMKRKVEFSKSFIPESFKEKEVYDLGCGDGRVTLLLKEIFSPSTSKKKDNSKALRGCDSEESLVKRAKERGIKAEQVNLEEEMPEGDLAIMWGVLHHLKNQREVLERIANNFNYFFLREPLVPSSKLARLKPSNLFELGDPFQEKEIKKMLQETLSKKGTILKMDTKYNSIFACWVKTK